MKRKNKKLALLVLVIAALFLLSGCSAPPTDEAGNIIRITTDTTFKYMFENESWFTAIIVYPLSQAINYLTPIIGVLGAIVAVTILVQLVAMLLTLNSTIQTQKMQMIQPEINKIQAKYEGKKDQASQMKQAQELQAVYNKYGVNPIGSILAMFIQFPIIIGMYHAVQRSYAVATGSFKLFGATVSLAETPLNGFKNGQWIYIALFVIMIIFQVGSMLTPQYLSERKAKMEAEKHHKKYVKQSNPMGNTMFLMMAPILIIAIMWPSAMTLYWAITSAVNIAKTLFTQFVIIDRQKG